MGHAHKPQSGYWILSREASCAPMSQLYHEWTFAALPPRHARAINCEARPAVPNQIQCICHDFRIVAAQIMQPYPNELPAQQHGERRSSKSAAGLAAAISLLQRSVDPCGIFSQGLCERWAHDALKANTCRSWPSSMECNNLGLLPMSEVSALSAFGASGSSVSAMPQCHRNMTYAKVKTCALSLCFCSALRLAVVAYMEKLPPKYPAAEHAAAQRRALQAFWASARGPTAASFAAKVALVGSALLARLQ